MGRGGEKGGPSMSGSVPEQGGGGAGEGRERGAGGGWDGPVGNARYVHGVWGGRERRSVLTTRAIINNSFSINGSCTGGARELTKPSPRHAEAKSEQAPEDTVRNEQHAHPELVEIWASEQNREKIRQVSLLPLPRC